MIQRYIEWSDVCTDTITILMDAIIWAIPAETTILPSQNEIGP